MNWHDPAERFALIQRVGVTEYKRLHAEHMAKSVVETVNGHAIRRTVSERIGVVYRVGTTGRPRPNQN
jgi:hypothetical protein